MTEFLAQYHLSGLFIGAVTFLIIGVFHPIVIRAEYLWGTRCWWIFFILGVAGLVLSLWIGNIILSAIGGVFSFTSFWTVKEVFEQRERVRKGWFPSNPKRKQN